MKVILLFIALCLASCASHQTHKSLESNNAQVVASAKEDEPLNVDFCDLLQFPEKYEQKLIRIKAIHCNCFERAELFSLKCAIQKSVWVEGALERCKNSGRIDELGYAGHPGWNDSTAGIIAVGKLIGTKGGYGHMNGYDYLFRIECLERAEIFDRTGNTRAGMIKEKRRKVEEFENSNSSCSATTHPTTHCNRLMMSTEQNNLGIQIRVATPGDASRVASVLHESFVEYESLYTPEGFAATTPTSDQIQSRMSEGPVWVALHDDVIVGTVAVVDKGEALYIRGMAVLPTARGRGIGELILKQVESYASQHGYKRLVLSTTPFLAQAIRLYEHVGFRRSSEGPHDLLGTPLFTMVKMLEPSN